MKPSLKSLQSLTYRPIHTYIATYMDPAHMSLWRFLNTSIAFLGTCVYYLTATAAVTQCANSAVPHSNGHRTPFKVREQLEWFKSIKYMNRILYVIYRCINQGLEFCMNMHKLRNATIRVTYVHFYVIRTYRVIMCMYLHCTVYMHKLVNNYDSHVCTFLRHAYLSSNYMMYLRCTSTCF